MARPVPADREPRVDPAPAPVRRRPVVSLRERPPAALRRVPGPGLLGRPVGGAGGEGEIGAAGGTPSPDVAQAIEAARGSGRPLPTPIRREMESALGADFSAVRIHQGEHAAALSGRLHAHAFTVGSDVFLGAGLPALSTARGQHVLAHELTHVVQNGTAGPTGPLTVGAADDPAEHAAEAAATSAMAALRRGPAADGSAPAARRTVAATAVRRVIRRGYADLDPKDREAVDHVAAQDFAVASADFEQRLGRLAARDPRAQAIATELVDRSMLLAETNYFNGGMKVELADHLADVFGIKDRSDISGTVGPSVGMIMEVFREGTFREKMSMFYVAMAERRSLDGMVDDMVTKLVKEKETYGKGGKKEDLDYATALEAFHTVPAPKSEKSGSASGATTEPVKYGEYAGKRKQKQQFKRLVEYILSELELERHVRAVSTTGKPAPKPVADEVQGRHEADLELSAGVIEKLTGGTMVGDETTDPGKQATLRSLVVDALGPAVGDGSRGTVMGELTAHAKRQTGGLGWLELQAAKPFADNDWIAKEISARADTELTVDAIAKQLRATVVEKVFVDLGGDTGASAVMKTPIAELQKLIHDELQTYIGSQPKWNLVTAAVKAEVDRSEAGNPTDHTVEGIARKQFNINLKANHTLLAPKSGLDRARQGTGRTEAPETEQRSDQTAEDIEAEGGDPLTYRELGAAFYTPAEFKVEYRRFEKEYRTKKGLKAKDKTPSEWKQEFRTHLMSLHGKKKLPWKPGARYWKMDPKSDFVQTAKMMRVQIAAGLSGTTDRVMRAALLLGFSGAQMQDVLLACLGWMLPARDHSYYEILKAAEPYLKVKPQAAYAEPLIDPQYANGYGYRKMLDFFPDLELPDQKLSPAYKDTLADKLVPPVKGEGEKAPAKTSTLMAISSSVTTPNAATGVAVTYSVRNAAKGRRYEWFSLRHGGGAARAVPCGVGESVERTWKAPGLYKLYCLVHDRDEPEATPIATLRYDETVVAAEGGKGGKGDELGATHVDLRATFSDLGGRVQPIPVAAATKDVGGTVTATLKVPKLLPPGEDPLKDPLVLTGTAADRAQRVGATETTAMFNRIYRPTKDPRLVHAEAMLAGAKEWSAQVITAERAGSVNVAIVDAATGEGLKEHFFALDGKVGVKPPLGDKDARPVTGVPAYRVQGGDFDMGISSSVRLVDDRDGRIGISGQAAVWVNFTDKARMVWWLSNRSDGSYSVAFTVTPDFLSKVRGVAVPEIDANVSGNKGKPIISQDKAAYQYAIGHEKSGSTHPSLEDMARSVVGQVVKLFQWKSFDIDTASTSDTPKGEGTLSQEFNENLQRAKDLQIKARFAKNLPHGDKELDKYEQHLAKQMAASDPTAPALTLVAKDPEGRKNELLDKYGTLASSEKAKGTKKWQGDYRTRLRKPGVDEISSTDRRLRSELSLGELESQFQTFVGTVDKVLKPIVAKALATKKDAIVKKATEVDQAKGDVGAETTAAVAGELGAIAVGPSETLLNDLPLAFRNRVLTASVRRMIENQLGPKLPTLPAKAALYDALAALMLTNK